MIPSVDELKARIFQKQNREEFLKWVVFFEYGILKYRKNNPGDNRTEHELLDELLDTITMGILRNLSGKFLLPTPFPFVAPTPAMESDPQLNEEFKAWLAFFEKTYPILLETFHLGGGRA